MTAASDGPADSGWRWFGPDSPCNCFGTSRPAAFGQIRLNPPGSSCWKNKQIRAFKLCPGSLDYNRSNSFCMQTPHTQTHPAFPPPCPPGSAGDAISYGCTPCESQTRCTCRWTRSEFGIYGSVSVLYEIFLLTHLIMPLPRLSTIFAKACSSGFSEPFWFIWRIKNVNGIFPAWEQHLSVNGENTGNVPGSESLVCRTWWSESRNVSGNHPAVRREAVHKRRHTIMADWLI